MHKYVSTALISSLLLLTPSSGLGYSMDSIYAIRYSNGQQYYGRFFLRTFMCQLFVFRKLKLSQEISLTELSIAGVSPQCPQELPTTWRA